MVVKYSVKTTQKTINGAFLISNSYRISVSAVRKQLPVSAYNCIASYKAIKSSYVAVTTVYILYCYSYTIYTDLCIYICNTFYLCMIYIYICMYIYKYIYIYMHVA